MYAVIDDNGKQYAVREGERIDVDLRDAAPGDTVAFDKVLFCGDADDAAAKVGAPYVENGRVTAEVEQEIKGKKVIHYSLRRRKNSRRKVGHRQRYLRVRITGISA
jgi:large subunit ribosomal protein L21